MSFNHRTTVSVGQGVIGGVVTWSRLTEGRGALVWFSGVLSCTRCTLIYSNVLWFTLVYFDLVWRTVKYLVHRLLSQTQYLGQNLFHKNCKYIHLD